MTRIIAGAAGGRPITVPAGTGTRPTADRAREALFSTLAGLLTMEGASVLDLYAGSGAIGLEALSRGAAHALFVEADGRAAGTIRRNAETLELAGAETRAERAERLATTPAPRPYDLVFADPPYALTSVDLARVLTDLGTNGWYAPDAVVVVERAARDADWVWPNTLEPLRSKRYGEAALWYGRRS